MNLTKIDQQITHFKQRIVKVLKLQQISQGDIIKQRTLCEWINSEEMKLKKIKDDPRGIKYLMGMVHKMVKNQEPYRENLENDLKALSQAARNKKIPKTFAFQSKGIPAQIINLVNDLKDKRWQEYYGQVRGPLLNHMFLMKKQDFHSNIEQVKVGGLKFMMIEQKVAHRYQRNLVQQLFGRVFRSKGSLSMVIKIQVNHDPLELPYNIFCYIEDRQIIDEDDAKRNLSDLKINENRLQIEKNGQFVQVNQLNILQIFLSQILVLPVQSLISQFIIRIAKNPSSSQYPHQYQHQHQQQYPQLIKCNQQSQHELIKESGLKQHPSLRNPLLYFSTYLRQHAIPISEAQKVTGNKELYACFYRCLEIVVKMLLADFGTYYEDVRVNSSICFNVEVFQAMWSVFHKISLISAWMNEVILPVKKSITISEIITHFCPIFNEISSSNTMAQNFNAYRDFYYNVEMQSYLGSIVSKKSLQKYKDIFLNESQVLTTKKYTTSVQIYNQIFSPVLRQINLQYINPIQASYILYFTCKYRYLYHPQSSDISLKWKQPKLWEKCIKCLKEKENQEMPFIDIGLDILGYVCGINVHHFDKKCFERVRNLEESEVTDLGVSWFTDFIREKYELASQTILSSLLEKSLKHKKFKTCKKLLQKGIRIRDFHQIIGFHDILNEMDQEARQQLVKTIQQDSPQMHRLFKWQQLMLVTLQKQSKDSVALETLDFGTLHIPREVLEKHIHNGRVINNLSRKDHKFNSNREIAHVTYKNTNGKSISFYLENSQYPLMPYFYKAFLNEIGTPEMMPYFTCFFYENRLFQIIQSINDSLNYHNGLLSFREEELNSLTDQTLISEAILISMIVLPSQIESRDITICPTKATRDHIFIVDWRNHYCKDFMYKNMGKVHLNSRNSLFLLQKMNKAIEKKLISKYSGIQIEKVCENTLLQCKKLNDKVNMMKNMHFKEGHYSSSPVQMLALMFEQGFGFTMVERMYKIKRVFSKKDNSFEKGLSFYRLLQIISCQSSYFYQEIFNSNQNILIRQKVLFDDEWKRPFLRISLTQFFGSFSRLQQKDNIFPQHYEKFCFEGPTENNVDVAVNNIKLMAYKTNEIPDNLADYTNDIFQYYMRNCDLSGLDAGKKEKLVEIIKNKSRQYLEEQEKRVLPLSYVCIKSMEFIKDKKLGSDVSFERVQELVIESCRVSEYELNYFPKTIQNILYLQLRDISGLKYIGQNVLYGKAIEIKHLKTLSIIDCNDLISIDLKCDILQNLQLRNNKSLQNINIFSLNLKNIYIFNNPNIVFENIAIYIIKGINVLVCKSSCHGDLMKVYAEDYETYVSYVMRFLMVKFFESSDSRYVILLTLLKMKEVDESLFTIGGIGSFKAFSTVFKNFSTDVEDRVLTELLRVYISNPHQRKMCIGDLIQSGTLATSSLTLQRIIRLINQALNKATRTKAIHQIKFQNTKFFFTSINSINIKTLADRLRVDKNVTLIMENLREQSQIEEPQNKAILEREVDTIRYVSIEKSDVQKVSLVFRKSYIRHTFLDQIFKDCQSLEQIIREEQAVTGSKLRRQKSGVNFRQTLKQNNHKLMKILNLNFQGCTIIDDRIVDLISLEKQLKIVESHLSGEIKVEESHASEMKIEDICKSSVHYGSVRYLKLENCMLESFQLIESLPYLTTLSVHKCQVKASLGSIRKSNLEKSQTRKTFTLAAYQRFYEIISKLQLQTLDLQNFFTMANSILEWSQIFDNFCIALKKMRHLKKLKLNKNYFSLANLKKLDQVLNSTTIQQLQLNEMMLPFDNIDVNKNEVDIQQRKAHAVFSTLFQSSENLKSLAIELNSKPVIESFIKSLSKNQSLIEFKLTTICQIPSTILEPLKENKTLSMISSNMQLPLWLLKHVMQNGKTIRKSMLRQQSSEQSRQQENIAMNTSLSLASMTSVRGGIGGDFYKLGLSLDGGGVRGMLLATELNYLASRVGYPLHKIFDCIGGTSIGGILALASAGTLDGENPVADTEELMNIFVKHGRDIFKKSQIMQLKNLFDTKYSASSFQGVLKNYFKDCRLSTCLSQTSVIITAVNRTDNKDYIFRSTEALLNRDKDFYLRDVGRATSAAPTYFPSAQIKNVNASMKLSLVDGGVGMNNPSKLVIDEVKKIAVNCGSAENYFLLSLGTGKLPSQVIPEYAGLKDLSPIIDSFTESSAYFVQRDLATNYKGHFFRVSPLINVKVKKDAELDNTSEPIVDMYRQTGLEAAKKYFQNTVMFGKYRNMNLIEWLRENTVRKYQY